MLRSNSKQSGKSMLSVLKKKGRLRWEGFADKKLSCRRMTARCVVSIEILPVATQQCRNYLYDKS